MVRPGHPGTGVPTERVFTIKSPVSGETGDIFVGIIHRQVRHPRPWACGGGCGSRACGGGCAPGPPRSSAARAFLPSRPWPPQTWGRRACARDGAFWGDGACPASPPWARLRPWAARAGPRSGASWGGWACSGAASAPPGWSRPLPEGHCRIIGCTLRVANSDDQLSYGGDYTEYPPYELEFDIT